MGFAAIRIADASKKNKVFAAELVPPGYGRAETWLRPDNPLPEGPFAIFPTKSADVSFVKGVAWANAIAIPSHLIVRKSLTMRALAPLVEAGEIVLRPAPVYRAPPSKKLGWQKGVMDDDFVVVDVRARFPADRGTLEASCFQRPDAPYASMLEWVPDDISFGAGRAPRASMFRIGDQPSTLVAKDELFAALKKALGPAIEKGESGPTFQLLDAFTEPKMKESAAVGESAAQAFYRMYAANTSSAKDRRAALASPIWSYWVGRLVDRAPSDDTRASACMHPFYAYAYARDVDRGPHAATRKGVLRDPCAAEEYAVHVDRAVHPSLRKALGYKAAEVEIAAHENVERFAAASGASAASSTASEFRFLAFAPDGRGVVSGSLRTPGNQLYAPYARRAPGAGVFVADEYGGEGRLRKQKSLDHLRALRDGHFGPLIVRKSAVAEVFAALPAGEVELVPVTLHDAKGKLDPDFVLVDVKTYAPMDRFASQAKLAHQSAPWTGGVNLVHRFAWTAATKPEVRIFRVLEFPYVLVADADLCEALAKATGRAVRGSDEAPTSEQMSAIAAPPRKVTAADEKAAAAAMKAFFAGDRKAALAHPLGALAVATSLDRKPSADTRKAVLASPRAALEYALFVDRGPHPDTRKAAATAPDTAMDYARYVDVAVHPVIRAAFVRQGRNDADWEAELADTRAALGKNAP